MLGQPQQGGMGGSGDCTQDIKNWWAGVNFIYRQIFICSFVLYIFSWLPILEIIPGLLMNYPVRTVYGFFFWTTCTTWIAPQNILNVLFGLYLIYQDGKRIERAIGSVHFFIEIVFKNFLIQVGYTAAMFLGYFIFSNVFLLKIPSTGLFPTFILFLALQGLNNPEQERPFCCFPVLIKNKWYVWILYVIFALLSASPLPDLLCAIGIAYLEVYVFKGQILVLKESTLQKIENSCLFRRFKDRADFVTLSNAGSESLLNQGSPVQPINAQPQPQQQAFQGRGVSIGQGILGHTAANKVINPSQNQPQTDNQNAIRAAAQAAMAREQEQQQDEDQEMEQQQEKQDNKKKDYNQLQDEQGMNEDLL